MIILRILVLTLFVPVAYLIFVHRAPLREAIFLSVPTSISATAIILSAFWGQG